MKSSALVELFDRPMAMEYHYYVALPENRQSAKAALAFESWSVGQISSPEE